MFKISRDLQTYFKKNDAEILREILMLKTRQFIRCIGTTNIDLQGGHSDSSIRMGKEIVQHVENGRFRHDKLLEILWVEIVAVDIDGRQENRFHLIMAKLVSLQVQVQNK